MDFIVTVPDEYLDELATHYGWQAESIDSVTEERMKGPDRDTFIKETMQLITNNAIVRLRGSVARDTAMNEAQTTLRIAQADRLSK